MTSPNHTMPLASLLRCLAAFLVLGLGWSLFAAARPAAGAPAAADATLGCVPTVRALGRVNVRPGPGVQFGPPIGQLFAGDQVPMTGRLRNNSWYRILFNQQEG